MALPVTLDHCVIHVTDWERSNAFYTAVLGAELIARPVGFAYRFGDRQLNVHGPGVAPAEVARLPVAPGNSDLCFEWNGPIADAVQHLERCGVAVEAGPMQRFGAKGAGASVYFRDPDGSLMEFISYARQAEQRQSREVPGKHDPTALPRDIPAPQDDGAARHLPGRALPDLALPATRGGAFNVSILGGRAVLYIYPRTGVPGVDLPPGWDDIPGARGCTPQSCSFRDHFAELKALGVAHVFGLSTQDTDYQREAAERLHLPFPLLSDAELKFTARSICRPSPWPA
jgi:peroxiredoxin/catechol 2,3-dioxygenase-like lactoylglutathione lyase family enzyme